MGDEMRQASMMLPSEEWHRRSNILCHSLLFQQPLSKFIARNHYCTRWDNLNHARLIPSPQAANAFIHRYFSQHGKGTHAARAVNIIR